MPTVNSNRDRVTRPKLGKVWCAGCDAYLVADGQRCPKCGWKHPAKRMRGNQRNRAAIDNGDAQ